MQIHFTVMAYAAFWSKEVDIYELDPQGKYSSYAYSISGIFKDRDTELLKIILSINQAREEMTY